MIWHSTFVQNELDALHKEYPQMTFALREEDDTFILVLPAYFDNIPGLDRVVLFHAINDMMQRLTDAGVRVKIEASPVL